MKCADFAGQRLLVEALHVARGQRLDRGVRVDLDERHAVALGGLADLVAGVGVGRNRGADRDGTVSREQACDEADAADVGVAILLREPEPFRQMRSHLVAVEDFDRPLPVEPLAQRFGQGALSGA